MQTDSRGYIVVDEQLRTNVEHIWAMGDCNGHGAFTHTSYNDFEIVAANVLDGDPRRVSDRITTYALYIDPPLGRAGHTVEEVRRSGRDALVGFRPMTRVGRAVEKGETQGFMKVVVDAQTKQILGAAILGVGGDEVIHGILDVMSAKAPYTTLARTMHIHPTVSELVPTMLQEMRPLRDRQQPTPEWQPVKRPIRNRRRCAAPRPRRLPGGPPAIRVRRRCPAERRTVRVVGTPVA